MATKLKVPFMLTCHSYSLPIYPQQTFRKKTPAIYSKPFLFQGSKRDPILFELSGGESPLTGGEYDRWYITKEEGRHTLFSGDWEAFGNRRPQEGDYFLLPGDNNRVFRIQTIGDDTSTYLPYYIATCTEERKGLKSLGEIEVNRDPMPETTRSGIDLLGDSVNNPGKRHRVLAAVKEWLSLNRP